MTIYFGRGITAESPGNAFTAAYDAAQLKQKQSKLADLLANAYGTQDQAQRQQYVQEAIRTDPQAGIGLAKLLQPAAQESFTLGPGAKRFGPDGRVIAEVPFAPKEPQQPEFDIRQIGNKLYYVPKSPMTGLPSTTPPISDSGNSPAADAGFQTLRDAVMWQESRGNPNAVSPKGAMGTMQTMPGTLRDPGFGVAPAADGSPQEMERVGTDYLRAMTEKYGPVGGLAAYNWGPGNWERALQAAGGDPQRALQMAPRETQQYVPSVLGRVGQGGGAGMGFGVEQNAGIPAGAIPIPGLPDAPGPFRARQYTPQEVKQMGLPAGAVAYTSEDGTPKIVSKPQAASGGGEKPIPVGALNKVLEAQDALGATQVISDIISKHAQRIKDNSLPFGPLAAAQAKARTFANMGTEADANFNEWEADKTKIVNESLRLNKGVQTEGDAQRAVKELMGANDRATAARALRRLADLNNRAVQLQRQKMQTIYSNYGRSPNGESAQQPQRPAASGGWKIEVVN